MPESVKPNPPSGYESWLDWWTSARTAIGGLGGLHECGLARDELDAIRARLATATELLREIEPLARHEIQCCLPRPEFAKRLAAFLEGCR